MLYVASPWSWGTNGNAPSTSDHTGVSLHTGVTEFAGTSVRRTRGVSGYINYFIGLTWKIISSLVAGTSFVTRVAESLRTPKYESVGMV